MKKTLIILLAFLAITFVLINGLKLKSGDVIGGSAEYQVLRVIDGDTIEVGKLGKVRYIGIDTPETKHPSKAPEQFGREAFEANRGLVESKCVKLELDAGERDRYGRILAYVYVGEIFVNAWLIENGYAKAMTVPPNVKYADLFVKLEREAREDGRGLWGISETKTVKAGEGYWASSKSNKFHRPSCRWAQRISSQNLLIFKSRAEALDSGYSPCKECKP